MRWIVSAVIGDGQTVATAYRAKAADHGDHSTLLVSRDDGSPDEPWCLVAYRGDVQALASDPDIVVLSQTVTAADVAALARLGCPPGLVVAGMRSEAAAMALGRVLDGKFQLEWLL